MKKNFSTRTESPTSSYHNSRSFVRLPSDAGTMRDKERQTENKILQWSLVHPITGEAYHVDPLGNITSGKQHVAIRSDNSIFAFYHNGQWFRTEAYLGLQLANVYGQREGKLVYDMDEKTGRPRRLPLTMDLPLDRKRIRRARFGEEYNLEVSSDLLLA